MIQREAIEEKVKIAIQILVKKDVYLLENNVHERSITHKLAEYLQILFPDLNVDCEYNKKGDATEILTKRIRIDHNSNEKEYSVYPDIIIHQRHTKNNLLIIEIKKKISNKTKEWDIEKLKFFTESKDYHYLFGLFIEFDGPNISDSKWYADGKERIGISEKLNIHSI
ncbi:MAG: hypothetical protein Q7T80_13150 [Methanoregula sp.]|nr:hypothetical protein [Methanoregula sp.]